MSKHVIMFENTRYDIDSEDLRSRWVELTPDMKYISYYFDGFNMRQNPDITFVRGIGKWKVVDEKLFIFDNFEERYNVFNNDDEELREDYIDEPDPDDVTDKEKEILDKDGRALKWGQILPPDPSVPYYKSFRYCKLNTISHEDRFVDSLDQLHPIQREMLNEYLSRFG